jgi:signal transduction histidine kinase
MTQVMPEPEELHRLRTQLAEREATIRRLTSTVDELRVYAGAVAHDLKGPLVTIDGYVELLRHSGGMIDTDEFLDEISRGAASMRTLIDGYLANAVAEHAALARTRVDLTGLVEGVVLEHVRRRRQEGGPAPQITVAPLPPVTGDPTLLRQVFDNLIGNAVKYTAPGEPAIVFVSARTEPAGGLIRVEVADRGIGVPDGMHTAIFDDFGRAHRDRAFAGTGLGLAICRRIVHRHGGAVGSAPNPGGGTQFWLTLPATDRALVG